jgi:hypothetical protein
MWGYVCIYQKILKITFNAVLFISFVKSAGCKNLDPRNNTQEQRETFSWSPRASNVDRKQIPEAETEKRIRLHKPTMPRIEEDGDEDVC